MAKRASKILILIIFLIFLNGCYLLPSFNDNRKYLTFPSYDLQMSEMWEMSYGKLYQIEGGILKARRDLIDAHYNNLILDSHFRDRMINYDCELVKIRAAMKVGLYRIYAGDWR